MQGICIKSISWSHYYNLNYLYSTAGTKECQTASRFCPWDYSTHSSLIYFRGRFVFFNSAVESFQNWSLKTMIYHKYKIKPWKYTAENLSLCGKSKNKFFKGKILIAILWSTFLNSFCLGLQTTYTASVSILEVKIIIKALSKVSVLC